MNELNYLIRACSVHPHPIVSNSSIKSDFCWLDMFVPYIGNFSNTPHDSHEMFIITIILNDRALLRSGDHNRGRSLLLAQPLPDLSNQSPRLSDIPEDAVHKVRVRVGIQRREEPLDGGDPHGPVEDAKPLGSGSQRTQPCWIFDDPQPIGEGRLMVGQLGLGEGL